MYVYTYTYIYTFMLFYACLYTCWLGIHMWRLENSFQELVLPLQVLGIKIKSVDAMASTFTKWALWLVLICVFTFARKWVLFYFSANVADIHSTYIYLYTQWLYLIGRIHLLKKCNRFWIQYWLSVFWGSLCHQSFPMIQNLI